MQIESFLKPQPETKSESLEFFILEDDPIFARLLSKSLHRAFPNSTVSTFENAIDAISALPDGCTPPSVIILDVLLTGPDGFTFLNEIASYSDLSNIPIIIVSSLNFPMQTLESYNVKKILNKATMTPQDLPAAISEILSVKNRSGQKSNLTKNRIADCAKNGSQKLNQEKGK
ncbi:response regulator [Candidatus Saccharibacteria bacterium]|nr:response regulator [Candidatus Saccharibacteria bacterium]